MSRKRKPTIENTDTRDTKFPKTISQSNLNETKELEQLLFTDEENPFEYDETVYTQQLLSPYTKCLPQTYTFDKIKCLLEVDFVSRPTGRIYYKPENKDDGFRDLYVEFDINKTSIFIDVNNNIELRGFATVYSPSLEVIKSGVFDRKKFKGYTNPVYFILSCLI